jgi:hypothetical protein
VDGSHFRSGASAGGGIAQLSRIANYLILLDNYRYYEKLGAAWQQAGAPGGTSPIR